MIAQRTIEQVRDRVLLSDLLSSEPGFRRSGSGFTLRCPFHDEKTPSFHVREDGKNYHCFGCGVSGNVFTYFMEKRGLSFPDAVEFLANQAGIPVEYEKVSGNRVVREDKRELLEFQVAAQNYFHDELKRCLSLAKSGEEGEPRILRDYLIKRKISRDAVLAFGVGYAPNRWNGLSGEMKGKFPEDLMVKSGLVRRNQRGELYDTFRGRLVFSISGEQGLPIAFGARTIPGLSKDDEPKYLNSPETILYRKSSTLFGLPQAVETARKKREVYLVEGYMDVIGLWQAGVKQSVACCGTALGPEHLSRLERLVNRIFLLFDGDDAGRKAAARCFTVALNSPLEVEAVFLSPEDDPDTLAMREGDKTALTLERLPRRQLLDLFIEFTLAKYNVQSPSQLGPQLKDRVCDEVAEQIDKCEKSIARDELYRRAGFLLLVDPALLRKDRRGSAPSSERNSRAEEAPPIVRLQPAELPRRDREVLHAVMAYPMELGSTVLSDRTLQSVLVPTTLRFVQELVELLGAGGSIDDVVLRELLLEYGPGWVDHWERARAMAEDDAVDLRRTLSECRESVRREQLQQTLVQLEREIVRTTDPQRQADLIARKFELVRSLKGIGAVIRG